MSRPEAARDDLPLPPLNGEAPWSGAPARAWLMADPRRYRRRAAWGQAVWTRTVWSHKGSRRYSHEQATAREASRAPRVLALSLAALFVVLLAAGFALALR